MLFCIQSLFSQKKFEALKVFTQKEWKGFYENDTTHELEQFVSWSFDLDSTVVKVTKKVPKINFEMEMIYYWDYEKNQATFIAFLNKPMNMHGNLKIEGNTITLHGFDFYKGDVLKEFKQTYTLEDGEIKDYFYRKVDGKWEQRHCIKYK